MKIAINKIHFPVTTLGYGRRVVIWTQGCSIRCPGCISKDTWQSSPEYDIEIEHLLNGCGGWLGECDGVTISGGEPFDQPEALAFFLDHVRTRVSGDLLVYSGYTHQRLFQRYSSLISKIDVLITEPYVTNASDTLIYRGSDNQRIFQLTSLARQRYPLDIDTQKWNGQRPLDVVLTGDGVWMAGIPRKHEMTRLKAKLKTLGYDCRSSDEIQPAVRA